MENAIHIPTPSLNVVGASLGAVAAGEVAQGELNKRNIFSLMEITLERWKQTLSNDSHKGMKTVTVSGATK